MDHSSDPDAVMCPTGGKGGGLPIFQGLGNDDAVGARYLYLQPALDRNPGFPEANKIILLVNETPDFDVAYDIWVTNDKVMAPLTYLGQGNIKPSELTYWIEKKDFYNEARRYRVRVQCNGQSFIKDGIAPQNQVSFFYSSGRRKGYFMEWPAPPSGKVVSPEAQTEEWIMKIHEDCGAWRRSREECVQQRRLR